MSPTHQDLSNDTTFSQIKSRVSVPLTVAKLANFSLKFGLIIICFSLIFWSLNYFSLMCFAETKFLNKSDSFALLSYKSKATSACFTSIPTESLINNHIRFTTISSFWNFLKDHDAYGIEVDDNIFNFINCLMWNQHKILFFLDGVRVCGNQKIQQFCEIQH